MCAPQLHCQHEQTISYPELSVMLQRLEVFQQPKEPMCLWNGWCASLLKSGHHCALPMNQPSRLLGSSLNAGEFLR
jgi:hypothetical protein